MEPNNSTPNPTTNNTNTEQGDSGQMAIADTILQTQKSSKNPSPLPKIFAVVLAVLLLAGGVWFGLALTKDDNTTKTNTDNSTNNQQTETKTHPVTEIVKEATDAVKASTKDAFVSVNSGTTNGQITIYDTTSKRYLVVTSKDDESATIELINSEDKTVVSENIAASIKKHDFADYNTSNWPADYQKMSELSGEKELWLKGNNYYCNIYTTALPSVEVACVNNEQIAANSAETKPFYDALSEVDEGTIVTVAMSTLKKSTKYPSYEYVGGGVGDISGAGAGAYWYRNNGGDWMFGYAKQAMPSCSEFTLQDMQKAFYDHSCQSGDSDTTVGDYYNL